MSKFYTGFGTRKILNTDIEYVTTLAQSLSNLGYKCRTGQMKRGIEAVFRASTTNIEIVKKTETTLAAINLMGKYHQSWNVIDMPNKKLLGRNGHLVMGKKLNQVSDFVIYYQRELADDSNGVAHTIMVAKDFGIPCFNIAFEEGRKDFQLYLIDQERKKDIRVFEPANEGVDHINIYSGANSALGRFLSNYSHSPFECKDGKFSSIEGYAQWIINESAEPRKRERLRFLFGHEARNYGLNLSDYRDLDDSQNEVRNRIKNAIIAKIEANPEMKNELRSSKLPFAYYYRKSGKAHMVAELDWIIEFIASYRQSLQSVVNHETKNIANTIKIAA